MVLRCSDGRCIPCVRYYCLASCEVISHVAEDTELPKDERGRCIVPFPNVDSSDLALAVEVVHGARAVGTLDSTTAPAALRGLQALGHTALSLIMMEQLWCVVCGGSFVEVQPHINELLHTESVRHKVLKKLAELLPTWPEFSSKVLGAVSMDAELASYLLRMLARFFPAGPLFRRVLDLLPISVLDSRTALSLFAGPMNASSYHPSEVVDVLDALARTFQLGLATSPARWDVSLLDFMRGLLTAGQVFDVAPHVANSMHGSIVLLERTPTASMLLLVHEKKGVVNRKMAPWISLHIDWATGVVDARITMSKLDDVGRSVQRCQARLSVYGGEDGRSGELWYVIDPVHPQLTFSLVDDGRYGAGCVETFRSLARDGSSDRLRVDLFYGEHSVLEKAFF